MLEVAPQAARANPEVGHAEEDDQRHGQRRVDVWRGGFQAGEQPNQVRGADEKGQRAHDGQKDRRVLDTHHLADQLLDGLDDPLQRILRQPRPQFEVAPEQVGPHTEQEHHGPGVNDC